MCGLPRAEHLAHYSSETLQLNAQPLVRRVLRSSWRSACLLGSRSPRVRSSSPPSRRTATKTRNAQYASTTRPAKATAMDTITQLTTSPYPSRRSVQAQRTLGVRVDLRGEGRRSRHPPLVAEPQPERTQPAGVPGPQHDPQAPLPQLLDALARVPVRDPPPARGQLHRHAHLLRGRLQQPA